MADKEPKKKQLSQRIAACIGIVAGVPLIPSLSWSCGGVADWTRIAAEMDGDDTGQSIAIMEMHTPVRVAKMRVYVLEKHSELAGEKVAEEIRQFAAAMKKSGSLAADNVVRQKWCGIFAEMLGG